MTTMITHVYRCPDKRHGEFDQGVPFGADVPPTALCPVMVKVGKKTPEHGQTRHMCRLVSPWVPPIVDCIWRCTK